MYISWGIYQILPMPKYNWWFFDFLDFLRLWWQLSSHLRLLLSFNGHCARRCFWNAELLEVFEIHTIEVSNYTRVKGVQVLIDWIKHLLLFWVYRIATTTYCFEGMILPFVKIIERQCCMHVHVPESAPANHNLLSAQYSSKSFRSIVCSADWIVYSVKFTD